MAKYIPDIRLNLQGFLLTETSQNFISKDSYLEAKRALLAVLQRQNSCLVLCTVGKKKKKENEKQHKKAEPNQNRLEAMSDLHNL